MTNQEDNLGGLVIGIFFLYLKDKKKKKSDLLEVNSNIDENNAYMIAFVLLLHSRPHSTPQQYWLAWVVKNLTSSFFK